MSRDERNLLRMPQPQSQPQALSLEDRIKQIRDEIDAVIDAKAAAVAKDSPGLHPAMLRQMITDRAPGCACSQYLEIAVRDRK